MWYPNQYITCSNCLERCRNIVYIDVKVIVLNAGITGTELSCSCTVLFHIIQNSIFFIFPRIKNFLDECTSSTLFDISNAAAVFLLLFLQLSWNPNLGSHQWLAVAGNAGLLRILHVANVGSRDTAARHAHLLSTQSSANGAG